MTLDDDATSIDTRPLPPGSVLAQRFRVGAPLGAGGMGEVYEGHDLELDRRVAIKVPPRERLHDPAWISRFLRQARALARIDHPGIVRVFDRGMHAERLPFLVMERLFGQDLAELIRQRGALPLGLVLELTDQLADAVCAMHAADVLHRDLKPSNVLFVENGRVPTVKLVDFGVAKLPIHDELTGTGEVLGTLAYLAPELLDGAKDASPASDVYALGCLMFELVTGRRAFRSQARGELLHAIRSSAPASARALCSAVPEALDSLIQRMMAKSPRERPDAATLRDELCLIQRPTVLGTSSWAALPEARPGRMLLGRFELVRLIGEGRQGLVYEAVDHKHGRRVALKYLLRRSADDLYRLKREYRTASQLSHPNLVRIEELFFDEAAAFLTMELLTGGDCMVLAAGSEDALRRTLREIAGALSALHAQNLIHRDLKPSNIRLSESGRVVLLDFGLTVSSSVHTDIAGTPPYMAPEVQEGMLSPAADMYALGVILHEMLTGTRPAGERNWRAALAADLVELCEALLAHDPTERPTADAVIALLERDGELSSVATATAQRQVPFLGRDAELTMLARELELVLAEGKLRTVLVHGESGIGKSALLEQFARSLPPSALYLCGRGRFAERVPYPALDSLVDSLSEHLQHLPHLVVRSLLPRDIAALGMLFPVLRRVETIADSTPLGLLPKDPFELRTRAFRAFKEFLRRVCDQRPVVLAVDDAQWIDPDSVALLSYCFAQPDPPSLLCLFARRDESESESVVALTKLLESVEQAPLAITVGPLSPASCRSLIGALVSAPGSEDVELISAQSGGHPFLLTLLAAYADGERAPSGCTELHAAILCRVQALPPSARELLERVAVCARPLSEDAFLSTTQEAPESLRILLRAHFVQRIEVAGVTRLDVYHARIREAVLSVLSTAQRRAHHASLASALEAREGEPEAHAEHLEGAGRSEAAAEVAVRAAYTARKQLAFERAASLFERARRLFGESSPRLVELLVAQSEALCSAGRGHQAGGLLTEAALRSEGEEGIRLRREAGRQLLLSGDIEGGLAVLKPLLDRYGIALPIGVNAIVRAGDEQLRRLEARGLKPAAADAQADPDLRARIELMLCVTQALSHCDMRGIPCAFESLHLALDLGDALVLQRAAALFVIGTASHMNTPLIEPALALCRELTSPEDAYAQALLHAADGEAQHFSGQFLAAEASFESAERLLLESCVGATRELSTVRNGAVLVQYSHKADFKTHVARTLGWLTDAEARRDRFHAAVLRVAHAIVWIAHDEPERARRELVRAETEWSGADGLFEVAAVLYHDIIDRYQGDPSAHLHPVQGRLHVLEGPAIRTSFLGGYVDLHRAWGALRALAYGGARGGETEMAEQAIAHMRGLGPAIWQAVALAFEGNLLLLRQKQREAVAALELSERTFRSLNMLCLAATARHRRGEVVGRAFGTHLVSSAEAELKALGVVSPQRWCSAYFSVFPPDLADERTLGSG